MRSRALRLTFGAVALIAIGAAAVQLFRSEEQIGFLASSVRVFDQHAREATDALADARVAQQAYVAAGQGAAFWMSKVSATREAATVALEALHRSAAAGTRTALDTATATAVEFESVDKRAREYLKSGQALMAADVIFTEGSDAAATAGRQVESARLAEHQAFDAEVAAIRTQQAMTIGSAAAVAAIIVLLLIPVPRTASIQSAGKGLSIAPPAPHPAPAMPFAPFAPNAMFKAAADLATDFGRVRDLEELRQILGRAGDVMGASGLMVWMGTTAGAELRPVLAHGYSPEMIARLPSVPRSADNAAAAAYRSGRLQIVLSRPGGSSGAVVAPILAADGCIGALSAEIRGGGETSEGIQALASIFAAHLAGVLSSAPAEIAEPNAATN
jgi:hypothetical protein